MKRGDGALLDPEAASAIKERVAGLERSTGVEVVAAVIARADSYPEIPWKAFALGASIALLAAAVAALVAPDWDAGEVEIQIAVVALATGAVAALATVWIKALARLFLTRARREVEALQYAQSMFLDAELQRTPRRDGILLLVSLFEREVVLLADRGVRDRLSPAALDAVVGAVTAALRQGDVKEALLRGLARLEETLAAAGFQARSGEPDEVAPALIQRGGPS